MNLMVGRHLAHYVLSISNRSRVWHVKMDAKKGFPATAF
jgi:hypothetical protein